MRVRKVERGVDLVEYVHGRRLELEQRHDEGEGDEGAGTKVRPDWTRLELDWGIRIDSQAGKKRKGKGGMFGFLAHR